MCSAGEGAEGQVSGVPGAGLCVCGGAGGRRAHLGWCSAGSGGPRRSGRGSRFPRRTPTGGSSGSARWRSGTPGGRRSGTLGRRGRPLARARHGGAGRGPRPTTGPCSPHSGDSSEPSAQSRSWSHTKCLGMHWRFWQVNSRSSQVLLYTADGGGSPLSPRPPADGHPGPPRENGQSAAGPGSATDPRATPAAAPPPLGLGFPCRGRPPARPTPHRPATHSSRPPRSRRRRPHSPCRRRRASARGHTRGCPGRRRSWGRTSCPLRRERGAAGTRGRGRAGRAWPGGAGTRGPGRPLSPQ